MPSYQQGLLNSLHLSEDALVDFIQTLPYPAHIKDIKTKKYIFSNDENIKIYGIRKQSDIIGLTVHDLNHKMQTKWEKEYTKIVDEMDYHVQSKNTVMTDNNRFLANSTGLFRFQTMIKTPLKVKGFGNTPKAILTYSHNKIDCLSKTQLFNAYLDRYWQKNQAINLFLQHLTIHPFFSFSERKNLISEKQIRVLLALSEHTNYKSAARLLNITYKTLESHIMKIKNKIMTGNLEQIISNIRNINSMES